MLCEFHVNKLVFKRAGKNTHVGKHSFPSVDTKSWLQGQRFEPSKTQTNKKKNIEYYEEDFENHDHS